MWRAQATLTSGCCVPVTTNPISDPRSKSRCRWQKLISALLVRLMTGAYALEGSGGDDGADVIRPVDGSVHV